MKKKILYAIAILSFISVNKAFSQFSEDSLRQKINRIVRLYVDTNKAGMVVGIIRKEGSESFSGRYTYGHVRRDTLSPRPDSLTIFHIGSVTKTYTANILSMLIQQGGLLNLNDFADDHLPLNIVKAPFYVNGSGDTVKMRIIDLATHFSALPDDPIHPVNDSTTYQMMYNYLNNHRLSRPPAECYLYSNLGISLLGTIVTHTLGSIIDSLFIQKLSNPLGMPDTRITLNSEQEHRRAVGYDINGDSVSYFKNSWPAFYAAGGLYTTLRDYMKYLEFNMGINNHGMQNVIDSAQKIRRVTNDTCDNPLSKGRIGLVWQMGLLYPQTDTTFYYTWKDGGVPGFVSFICFAENKTRNLKTGVVMIANQSIPPGKLAVEILKYLNEDTVTGIMQITNNIPEAFILYQNYPNPFNPETHLEFEIPEGGFVSLKVFDLLGNEVAVLVNEKLSPGRYKTNFNVRDVSKIRDLSSGVYFYRLKVNGFEQTKRMVLLK